VTSGSSVVALGAEHEMDLRVATKTVAAEAVVVLELEEVGAHELPGWQPGAHVDLVLAPGVVRQYSLCGDPADRRSWRVAVLREEAGRGGSVIAHDALHEGSVLHARGPRNHFPLKPARTHMFVAGGIGITPFLPMIRALESAGGSWRLLYGGRSRRSMAFLHELATYGERVLVRPQDEFSLLDLDAAFADVLPGTSVYCCGPEALLQAVEDRAGTWAPGTLHVERFGPRPVVSTAPDTAFDLVCQASGLSLHVPADRSVLDVVTEAGIEVLTSCTEGTCGSCETRVVAGRPDQRDSVLSEEDRGSGQFMMICVSRSLTPELVLDL
jgi:ferredoxin-NADP reductase